MKKGGVVFEHGNSIVALIIDPVKLEIKDQLIIDIDGNGHKLQGHYTNKFAPLSTWLQNKYSSVNHKYLGARHGGTGPQYTSGKMNVPFDTANDTKAFLAIISAQPNVTWANPQDKDLTAGKAIVEILFWTSNVSQLKACSIIMRDYYNSLQAGNVSYKNTFNKLQRTPKYKQLEDLIELMLPASQRKRIGFTQLKKAIDKWNNPTGK